MQKTGSEVVAVPTSGESYRTMVSKHQNSSRETHLCLFVSLSLGTFGLPTFPSTTHSIPHPLFQPP